MFDYHMHSKVSFDSEEEPALMVKAAEEKGLLEICFTDHIDHNGDKNGEHYLFTMEEYNKAYSGLKSDKVKIRRGVELGMTDWNKAELDEFAKEGSFDFVIGSIHYAGGIDPYFKEYWEGISFFEGIEKYMKETLRCVKIHDAFDVLGHLTYVVKSSANPLGKGICYSEISDYVDEIFKIIIEKGKGIEVNTSGVDKVGDFLPSLEYLKRFRALGGEIITVGSDSHDKTRVGQYTKDAIEMIGQVFPYVCTFSGRKPIFHKI